MGPKFGVVGESFETELPAVQVPEEELQEERKAARFSKTTEFKKIKEHFEQRITFYQTWLPNGVPVKESELSDSELGSKWRAANTIINEFNLVLSAYEQAREVVEDADRRIND